MYIPFHLAQWLSWLKFNPAILPVAQSSPSFLTRHVFRDVQNRIICGANTFFLAAKSVKLPNLRCWPTLQMCGRTWQIHLPRVLYVYYASHLLPSLLMCPFLLLEKGMLPPAPS
jgi:hypothetical protein